MIGIAPEKVVYLILRARELDAKVPGWEDDDEVVEPGENENGFDAVLEDYDIDEMKSWLGEYIDGLNVDEKEALVALTWVGRGTYAADEYDRALAMARSEHINATRDYLLGFPLLSEYLEEGLAQMGYDVEQLEEEVIDGGGLKQGPPSADSGA